MNGQMSGTKVSSTDPADKHTVTGVPVAISWKISATLKADMFDGTAAGASRRILSLLCVCYNRQGRKANVGAGTATATEPTREHKQYATQGPTTYLCT